MKQFLTNQAKDNVLMAWGGLKLEKGETIHKYTNKFWDFHVKAIAYKKIVFLKQKQQFCTNLNEDMKAYVNVQKAQNNI